MTLSRRDMLLALAGLGLGLAGCERRATETPGADASADASADAGASAGEGEAQPLQLLILGGTGFLGPHFVEAALARGHTVTLFNRGKTNPHLFPDLEKLQGDRREGDLKALEGRRFDAVVDTSGYLPQHVDASARLLADSGQYLFVSSVSAYRDLGRAGLSEADALAPHPEPGNDDMQFYGPLKALCEQAAEAAMPGKTTVIRPGLIVGPGDPTDRFTYWPARLARGGEVMAPGLPDDPVQLIDARDLAAFMLRCIEQRQFAIYNTVGPGKPLRVGDMLGIGARAVGSEVELTWVAADFLAAHAVEPWTQMTVWVPPSDPEFGGITQIDGSAALAAGLRHRPLAETFVDTLAYWNDLPEERRATPRAGLEPAREQEVLAAWHGRESVATPPVAAA